LYEFFIFGAKTKGVPFLHPYFPWFQYNAWKCSNMLSVNNFNFYLFQEEEKCIYYNSVFGISKNVIISSKREVENGDDCIAKPWALLDYILASNATLRYPMREYLFLRCECKETNRCSQTACRRRHKSRPSCGHQESRYPFFLWSNSLCYGMVINDGATPFCSIRARSNTHALYHTVEAKHTKILQSE
jgi:hypothetical protein